MLIALFADIHANREALVACLAHAGQSGAGRYVFLGDYVGYNADPEWVVDTVQAHVERGATAILGNHDAAVLAPDARMNPVAAAAIEWTRGRLGAAQREFLRRLPFAVEERTRLFVHANAWAPGDWGYVTDVAEAAQSLLATSARVTFCGHVHVPALYSLTEGKVASVTPASGTALPLSPERRWLAVLGAVGQPRDRNSAACYALFDDARDLLTYVRVPYDVETAARKVREAGLPLVLSQRLEHGY
jgi:diadenosine tetraphosphatase ApaH/serine/threonine PP2A family protein phosphatase